MNLRLYTSKEDSVNFSRSFSTKLHLKFERSTFLFVDFSLNGSHQDVFKIQVFYSENGLFYTKFSSSNLIRLAFGKWNQLNFMLARDKNKPLTPLFIFDFPLDNSKSQYDATFANVNGELHILSKIYNLSDEHFKILKKSYKLYKIKGADYTLFDFGNCLSYIGVFLNNLEAILEDIDFKLNDSNELIINPIPLDSITKREDDYKYCMICGKKLESTLNKNLLELSRKFPARCETCLKQIYSLELYYKLNEGSISTNMLSVSELEYIWDEEGLFEYNFKLLKDYGFLKPFSDDIYKIYLNEEIDEAFNSLLNPIEEKEEDSSSKSALDDYFGFNDDKEKPKCRICGEEIEEDDGTDICSNCFEKQMTIEKIHKLIEYVKPGSGFSKSSLIEKGFNHIDLDIIISDLEEQGLLRYDSDDLIILANKSSLNEFIKEYSDSDEYIIESTDEGLISTLVIYKEDLNDEQSLDKAINLIDYQEYVEFSSNSRVDGWNLTLKKEDKEFLHKLFYNPFQAKLAAINYLNEIGVIRIVDYENDIDLKNKPKSKKKLKNKNKYAPPEEGRGKKTTKKCPLCGKKFIVYPSSKNSFCSSCISKYSFFEKKALDGIIKGKFDKALLRNILLFREEGDSDLDIAKKLNLEHDFLIKPLVKFLSDDDLLNRISENLSEKEIMDTETEEASVKASDSHVSDEEKKEEKGTDFYTSKEDSDSPTKKLIISDNILKSQDLIDEAIDFDSYMEYCYLSSVGENKVVFKKNGEVSSIRKYRSSYEAKLSMIEHLEKLDIIEIKDDLDNSKPIEEESTNEKICPVCQNKFVPSSKNQLYCKECRYNYNNAELQVLAGINNGIYTESMALEIKELLNQGHSKSSLCNKFKIKNTVLISLILKYLLKEDISIEEEIYEEKDKNKDKICPICKKTFVPKANQKYCNDCKSKFSPLELGVLYDIEQGKYTEETAIEIAKLKQEDKSNQQISNILKLSHPNVITPILNFLLKDADLSEHKEDLLEGANLSEHNEEYSNIKLKICPICNEEFSPKSRNGLDLCCSDCRDKYTHTEITLLVGVKKGLYTEELADKFLKLKNSGFSNKYISEKYDIPVTLLNPIIHYFKDNANDVDGISFNENLSKWLVNVKDDGKTIHLGFYDTKDEAVLVRDKYYNSHNLSKMVDEDKLVKQLFYKDCGNNYSKIFLKGIISEKDRVSIFDLISFVNCNLNKILCERLEDNNYDFLLDIDIENRHLNFALKDLKLLGWKNAE